MSTLRLAGVIRESIVDGPGIRFAVFAQGCPHHCPGCHNPQTWPFEGGSEAEPEKIIGEACENPLLRGITLSGGEPFCQCAAMAELAALAHARGLDVVTYTGYTFERLLEKAKDEPETAELLGQTDLLVDGPFIETLKSYDLLFCGSSNQRVLDLRASLEKGEAVRAELGGDAGFRPA
ncbi:MAG: anaerobic ribonucleoside-triphosphate reductase activating protein [Clostridia bacterium]|nr:anaerobic ribonucleoside-triphosphate reductase activating protein [Clostridia bacterium]